MRNLALGFVHERFEFGEPISSISKPPLIDFSSSGEVLVVTRSNPIIAQLVHDARRVVLIAFCGAGLVFAALLGRQEGYRLESTAAIDRVLAAKTAADRIAALESRLEMDVNAAAQTGDLGRITDYDAARTHLDQALGEATLLANPLSGDPFGAEVRLSRDRLALIDRAVFDHVRAGDMDVAQALVADPVYQSHRKIVTDATERFVGEVVAEARSGLETSRRIGLALFAGLVLATGVVALFLWRRLAKILSEGHGRHNDAVDQIKRLAMNDTLTGLANRAAFREGLSAAMARAKAAGSKVAVLMIDLDRFKPINDRHGHLVGDIVLKEIANRMRTVGRSGELRGRFGGDEFVALVEYTGDESMPMRVGERMVAVLSEPIVTHGLTLDVGASVGIASYPSDADDDESLIGKADVALYRAKRDGRGVVRRYDASMDADIKAAAALEKELAQSIKNKTVAPHYQPLIDLATGTIVGFEVLARWHHPTRGLIQPVDFIKVAERANLLDDLTLSLLTRACLDMRAMPPHITIALNLSQRQVQDERIAHRILAVLSKTQFTPGRLEIELTESTLVNDIEASKTVISALKSLGIKVVLDDFGTGYSSLSYLSELAFDKIKIDRSFIRTIHDRRESIKAVSAIVGLGKSLGVPTIAEGIESERDEEIVRAMGCLQVQGYYYSKPLPAADLPPLMAKSFGAETVQLLPVVA
jgi:diguanylate cyclase (GGDEF)-like protein